MNMQEFRGKYKDKIEEEQQPVVTVCRRFRMQSEREVHNVLRDLGVEFVTYVCRTPGHKWVGSQCLYFDLEATIPTDATPKDIVPTIGGVPVCFFPRLDCCECEPDQQCGCTNTGGHGEFYYYEYPSRRHRGGMHQPVD